MEKADDTKDLSKVIMDTQAKLEGKQHGATVSQEFADWLLAKLQFIEGHRFKVRIGCLCEVEKYCMLATRMLANLAREQMDDNIKDILPSILQVLEKANTIWDSQVEWTDYLQEAQHRYRVLESSSKLNALMEFVGHHETVETMDQEFVESLTLFVDSCKDMYVEEGEPAALFGRFCRMLMKVVSRNWETHETHLKLFWKMCALIGDPVVLKPVNIEKEFLDSCSIVLCHGRQITELGSTCMEQATNDPDNMQLIAARHRRWRRKQQSCSISTTEVPCQKSCTTWCKLARRIGARSPRLRSAWVCRPWARRCSAPTRHSMAVLTASGGSTSTTIPSSSCCLATRPP